MTANATIDVASAHNALTVPLTALHGLDAPRTRSPWGQRAAAAALGGASSAGSTARLIVDRDGKPVPVQVRVTLTNGTQAAVQPVDARRRCPPAIRRRDRMAGALVSGSRQRWRALAGERCAGERLAAAGDSLMKPVVEVAGLQKIYALGASEVRRAARRRPDARSGRVRRRHGSVGLGKIDVHAHRRALDKPSGGRVPLRRRRRLVA